MKKILNQPGNFVDEMVEGILLAHPDQLKTPATTVASWCAPTPPSRARSGS